MIGSFLLDTLWQGAIIVVVAAIVTALLPRRSAATRYAVWFAALLALVVLPALAVFRPFANATHLPIAVTQTTAVASGIAARTAHTGGSWLVALWLAGVAIGLLRLVLNGIAIRRILRRGTPMNGFGGGVLVSDVIGIPIAAGVFAPKIVIPQALVKSLDPIDLESIVRHERAHIQRMDLATNLVQRVLEALLFFNPAVYAIGRQLIKEREAACDDVAVHATHDADRHALCLSRVAQNACRSRSLVLSPSAIGSKHMLVARIARLLNGEAGEVRVNYVVLGASIACFAIVGVLLQTRGLAASASCTSANGNTEVKVVNPIAPDIPKADVKAAMSTEVLVTVNAQGTATNAKLVKSSGNDRMDNAVMDAATKSTYSPAMKACKPVAGTYLFRADAAR